MLFLLFLLISCGGGNSNSDQTLVPPQNVAPQPLFNDVPIKLDDAISIYGQACPDPSFQFLIPVKINADNFVDFIAHFWCDSDNPAAIDDKPTDNTTTRDENTPPIIGFTTYRSLDRSRIILI